MQTSLISSDVMAPGMSCLLAKTSKVAPANLYILVIIKWYQSSKMMLRNKYLFF